MLKSCQYCGRIHEKGYDCGKRPVYTKDRTEEKFRSSRAWQRKREKIRQRDLNLCRLALYYENRIVCDDLSVHHIEPLAEVWESRLEDGNLITLSRAWHEEAEAGNVPRELLHTLAGIPPAIDFEKLRRG